MARSRAHETERSRECIVALMLGTGAKQSAEQTTYGYIPRNHYCAQKQFVDEVAKAARQSKPDREISVRMAGVVWLTALSESSVDVAFFHLLTSKEVAVGDHRHPSTGRFNFNLRPTLSTYLKNAHNDRSQITPYYRR